MTLPQALLTNKDNNPSSFGKLVLMLLACSQIASAEIGKKHRRELPVPKKEAPAGIPNTESGAAVSEQKSRPKSLDITNNNLENSGSTKKDSTRPKFNQKSVLEKSTCTEKYPIETFMQVASATNPQSSKRGGVYFVSDLREAPQVYSLETPGAWPEQLTFFPDGLRYYEVSPDKNKMLLAADEGGDEQYDIYLFDIKSKQQKPLLVGRQKRIDSVHWSSKSDWFAYTSTERNQKDLDLYKFDLGTMKSTLLTNLEGHHTVSDISQDGNLIALTQFRSVTDSDILVFNQKTKKLENITKDSSHYSSDPAFTRDGENLFYISDKDSGILQIFLLNINSKKTKQLTSGKWGIDLFKLNSNLTSLFYATNEEGYSKLAGFSIASNGEKHDSLKLPTISKEVVGGFSPAETYGNEGMFLTRTSSTRTSDVWLWRKGALTQWTQSTNGPMNTGCYREERLIHYPSFDKTEIPAFVYLPKGYSFDNPSPIPFIVSVHGGPESQYRPGFSKSYQYFLQQGFGVFAPNIRGSTGYGRDYTLKDNYKLRMDSIQDIAEGAKWLIKNQFTQSKKLSISGGSYGGFAVLRTIEVEPNLFAAASSNVGISNFITFLKNTKPYRRALREIEYGPLSDEEFLKTISPINFIDQIKTPLLVFHGANDPRVPVAESEQMVEALRNKEVPVELTIFKDEGHGNKKLSNIIIQAKQMALFFDHYLNPVPIN